jgi:hypothetical protein
MLYADFKKVYLCRGEMAERSNAAVLKTVDPVRGPGVRIPLSPPLTHQNTLKSLKINVLRLFLFYPNSQKMHVFLIY